MSATYCTQIPQWRIYVLTAVAGLLLILVDLFATSPRTFFGVHKFVSCTAIPSQLADVSKIRHCQSSSHAGVFIITQRAQQKTVGDCVRDPVYRLRIAGPEILSIQARKKGLSFVAEYRLYSQGFFHAEILQLYAGFSICGNSRFNRDMLVGRHVWHVDAPNKTIPCDEPGCPMCPPAPLLGRWFANVSSPRTARLVRELERTHEFNTAAKPGPASLAAASVPMDANELRWQPLSPCTITPTEQNLKSWRAACNGASRVVCFAGDSQMRHLHAMANAVLSNTAILLTESTYKRAMPSSWSRYTTLTFGDELDRADFKGCHRVLLNIGQWPLGWPAGKPWPTDRVESRALQMLDMIHTRFPHLRGYVFWISTQPVGIMRNLLGNDTKPPNDWRTDPYITRQNAAMRTLASQRKITYIDTFDILYHVSDLSYDGAHYLGTPGYWAAALVLNAICQK